MATSFSTLHLNPPPIPRTRLIGREVEQAAAHTLLLEEAVPLLTLTGPGGVGKTRLALAVAKDVANQFADGAVWVDLAPLAEPALVPMAVARACELSLPASGSVEESLIRSLRSHQTLLLIDNCEHLLSAVGDLVAPLLASCAGLQVLATSRAPLRVRGEQVLPVPPFSVADETANSLADVSRAEAVRLFEQRTREVDPVFALTDENARTVAAICRRLDGLPLAIELAAARSGALAPTILLTLLNQNVPVLGTAPQDAAARHRTLHATIAWSYELLTPQEQALFRHLSVFAGGFTLEAAVAVGALPIHDVISLLERLLNQSLISRRTDAATDGGRYTMLETIREFGLEQLTATGEAAVTRDRHAAYFRHLVKARNAVWAAYLPNAQQILDELEMEYPNLRAALAWQRETGDVASLLELGGALFFF